MHSLCLRSRRGCGHNRVGTVKGVIYCCTCGLINRYRLIGCIYTTIETERWLFHKRRFRRRVIGALGTHMVSISPTSDSRQWIIPITDASILIQQCYISILIKGHCNVSAICIWTVHILRPSGHIV